MVRYLWKSCNHFTNVMVYRPNHCHVTMTSGLQSHQYHLPSRQCRLSYLHQIKLLYLLDQPNWKNIWIFLTIQFYLIFSIVKGCPSKYNWWNIWFHSTFGHNPGFISSLFVKILTKATAAPPIDDTKLVENNNIVYCL